MYAFAVAIFTSAFLVFQLQPIIARFILPWYGGTPAVWTTCMLFFQIGLLGGYAYAHVLARYVPLKKQVSVHLIFIALSFLTLPITPSLLESNHHQTLAILLLLFSTVGLPFILLSASAPLLQHWFSKVHPNQKTFRLYALSNTGSLLALVSYPFIVEPLVKLSQQTIYWSLLYGLFFIFCFCSSWPILRQSFAEAINTDKHELHPPSWPTRLLWMLLAACGSIALLAITNQISKDVAVIPFLWVLPLSLYLISFIICFDRDSWYRRIIWLPFLAMTIAALLYLLKYDYYGGRVSLAYQAVIYCAAMFACCMVCHGEMVRKRPTENHLTLFYLYVALGGALGGVFVNVIAPLLFDGYWELHLVLLAVMIIASACLLNEKHLLSQSLRIGFSAAATTAIVISGYYLWDHKVYQEDASILNIRDFYGVLHVYDESIGKEDHYRSLYHGRTLHGEQWLHDSLKNKPSSYYGYNSGIGLAMTRHTSRLSSTTYTTPLKAAMIGLGAGTMAAYGEPGDTFSFYEIDPNMEYLAKNYFSYLEDSKANNTVILGDGRLSLAKELQDSGSQQLDILALDAFSGDAIPMHLLTSEASDMYWKHLKENGILAIHLTNRHFDLTDIARQLALRAGKKAIYIVAYGDEYNNTSEWVLITSNVDFLKDKHVIEKQSAWEHSLNPIIWTDDFSNLFDVVNW
ncbi:MAG: hypothetical protein ACI9D5_000316 [Candidatus Endobugula sp.]|jgi:hypothetical protein